MPDKQTESLAELGKRSLYFLARGILGKDYMQKHVHMDFCDFLEAPLVDGKKDKLVVLPRSFLKSTTGCIAYPLWEAIKNPNIRILIVCNIIDNAMNHLRQIKSIVESNETFRRSYPEIIPNIKKVRWSDHSVELKRDIAYGEGTFEAAGLGQNIVSRHYDMIIMDDILTGTKDSVTRDELAPSQLEIERAIGWYKLAVSLLDTPSEGRMLYQGTRWALHDVIDYILNEDRTFATYIQNIYKKENGKTVNFGVPIYPERFNQKALDDIKNKQGSYIFASQYLLDPLPAERMVFKPDYIQYYRALPSVPYWIYTYVDPAISSKKKACYTAIVTIARTFDNKIYVMEVIREKGLSISQLSEKIFSVQKRLHPRLIGIESIAYQEAIGKHLREQMRAQDFFFNIRDDTPTRDEPKDARIRGMEPRFESHSVWIKEHMNGLETELLEFQGVENSRYVDAIDALAGAIKISSCPPPPIEVEHKEGVTMEDILTELRDRSKYYRLPFGDQLGQMGAPRDNMNSFNN